MADDLWVLRRRRSSRAERECCGHDQAADRGAGNDDGDPPSPPPGQDSSQLSRSVILQTALAIVDRDGVDGLSMRRLSNAVGRIR